MKQTRLLKKKIAVIVSLAICTIALSSTQIATAASFNLTDGSGSSITTTNNGSGSTSGPTTTTGNVSADTSSIVAAIIALGNKIEAISIAATNYVNNMTYQYNPDLPKTMSSNTAQVLVNNTLTSPDQYARDQANATNQVTTNNSLAQIAFAITPPTDNNALSDLASTYQDYLNDNSVTSLTQKIKASDSPFYLSKNLFFTTYPTDPDAQFILKPADRTMLDKNNKIFNFGNLITPTTYTNDENIAASRFIQYSTKNFKPLTNGINFNKLNNVQPSELYKFVTSPDFQKYQLDTRSQIALRSISQVLLNELVAERTPIKDFCIAPGKCNVSSLESQKYLATRRSTDPNWYRMMSVAPPATVQREILFVLVEMQKQNYQAHLDNERLMSALTAIALQNSDASEMSAQVNATKLNRQIDTLLNVSTPDDDTPSPGPGNYMPDNYNYKNGNQDLNMEDLKKEANSKKDKAGKSSK